MPFVDLSHPIRPGMPAYPGDGPTTFTPVADYANDGYRERTVTMPSHTGTHIDPPGHMIPGRRMLDEFPIEHFIGRAGRLDVTDLSPGSEIEAERLTHFGETLSHLDYLLVETGWAARWGEPTYFENIPVFSPAAAQRLAELSEANGGRLRGVGLDVSSVDPVGAEDFPIHEIFLGAGLLIVENVADLSAVPDSDFTFSCPPLPLADADGAPCRAWASW
ncbi:cyclase family protein [Alienimonas chondri]|uniref:Kynurenine formamidase n=1 Tax=Alienimonas chondri TaxID=2681879 RepID=A0ABX1VIG7_9PLAN|nr:cyclase family protein [Alienimonas chondri]NNJ27895.1 Kynurenine formamidase [Alienimonas chondri]